MPAVLTLLLFIACGLAFCSLASAILARSGVASDWRDALLLGSLLGGTAIAAITEGLSLATRFERGWLLAAWVTVLVAAVVLSRYLRSGADRLAPGHRGVWRAARELSPLEIAMLSALVIQVLLLLVVALVYPPNNYDSMAYHMARIAHWEQARSVAFYPSGIYSQIRGAPFAEYAIAQPQLLSGGDWYANLVQWFAMVLSATAVSLVAAEFGAGRLRQIASALLSVSIPMGILQATSTQNDYVLAAWLTCFVVSALRFLRSASASWLWTCAMSAALGLAILTKQTAYAYAPAFCLLIALGALKRTGWAAVGKGVLVVAIVAVINAGFVVRTAQVYGSPLGPTGLANEYRSVGVAVSNTIRNLAVNLGLAGRIDLIDWFSTTLLNGLEALHALTGLDPRDPRTTLTPAEDPFALRTVIHEDLAGNLLHSLLTIASIVLCFLSFVMARLSPGSPARTTYRTEVLAYTACVVVAFVFFGYYFKWQVWGTRLQLSLFVLSAPLVATVLFASSRRLLGMTAIVVGLSGFVYTFGNVTRPLGPSIVRAGTDRTEWYFANRPDLSPVFRALTDAVAETPCRRIGLRISADPFEYPLWVLFRNRGLRPTMKHVETLIPLPLDAGFEPCAVVSAGEDPQYADATTRRFGGFFLYLPAARPRNGDGS